MQVKVYAVLTPDERLVALKLTRFAAHSIARELAPCKVRLMLADKEPAAAASAQEADQWQSPD